MHSMIPREARCGMTDNRSRSYMAQKGAYARSKRKFSDLRQPAHATSCLPPMWRRVP